MKKVIAILMMMILVLSMAGCQGGGDEQENGGALEKETAQSDIEETVDEPEDALDGIEESAVEETTEETGADVVIEEVTGEDLDVDAEVNEETETRDDVQAVGSMFTGGEPQLLIDVLNINPKKVYYEVIDGNKTLVMEAFITNGFGHDIWNINIGNIELKDENDVLIAQGEFGELGDVVIASNSHLEWVFHFGADAVVSFEDDLQTIKTKSISSYNY
ncbi:MAG: hypothetical protein K9L62_16905 [Vallitaleaceae bacterium]|nr:hypothetical protein [Vallitaleaceae bacterium]